LAASWIAATVPLLQLQLQLQRNKQLLALSAAAAAADPVTGEQTTLVEIG